MDARITEIVFRRDPSIFTGSFKSQQFYHDNDTRPSFLIILFLKEENYGFL